MTDATDQANHEAETASDGNELVNKVITVGAITVVAALFEASLIPGMVIGVGAMLVPDLLPKLSSNAEPMLWHLVRGAYRAGRKAQSAFAEAKEQMHDIVAESEAENPSKG